MSNKQVFALCIFVKINGISNLTRKLTFRTWFSQMWNNSGVGKVIQWKSHLQKAKHQRAAKSVCSVNVVCFGILLLCGLQLPLCEEHSLSFWWSENNRMSLTLCLFETFYFCSGILSSLTWALGSPLLLSNRVDPLVTNFTVRTRVNTLISETKIKYEATTP